MVSLGNLNPFKKKDNTYKLDEHTLPSLSETMSDNNPSADQQSASFPDSGLPDLGSSPSYASNDDFSLNQPASQGVEMPQSFSLHGSEDASMNVSPQSMGTANGNFHPSPFPQQHSQNNNSSQEKSDINNEISKHKIESMEAKITLIDARLSNIEQKLELLNKLILEEISDETKRKLNVQSMMGNIRK